MNVAPFFIPGINQMTTAMGLYYHLVPQMEALCFGPIECARHTFADMVNDDKGSMLVIDDVQAALGETENLIRQAVLEIAKETDARAFMLLSACQTAFLGLDLENLCASLHEQTGLAFSHLEVNRMAAEHIPGHTRKFVPGGDRYHSRVANFRLLEQADQGEQRTFEQPGKGVILLCEDELDPSNDLFDLVGHAGIEWVRGVGDCRTFDEFAQIREARVSISTSIAWREVGEYLEKRFGIPHLYLPTSYVLDEVDAYYRQLDSALRLEELLDADELVEVRERRAARRAAASEQTDVMVDVMKAQQVELDLRVILRPFCLCEELVKRGVRLHNVTLNPNQTDHKEEDDLLSYERLVVGNPLFWKRFQGNTTSNKRKEGPANPYHVNKRRSGRYVDISFPVKPEHVPEETAWWGYSSISKLMNELAQGRIDRFVETHRAAVAAADAQPAQKGRWSL